MKIRKARLKEVDEISYLQGKMAKYHLKFDKYWETKKGARKMWCKYAKRIIRSPKGKIFVAEVDGKIVGYTLGKIEKRPPIFKVQKTGLINDAFVLKKYRRRGIGKRLIDKLLEWFKSKDIEIVELDVDVRNEIGLNAWKKFKFKRYLVRKKREI